MMQAAPAYTAVSTRQTLQRPPPPTSPKPSKVTWSPDVREYVQRAFERDNAIPGIDQKAMSDKLKFIITDAAESGRIDTIDWSTYPLPQHLIRQEQLASNGVHHASLANLHTSVPSSTDGAGSPRDQKKRKSSDMDTTPEEQLVAEPPFKKTMTNGLEDRITGKSKKQDKKQKKIDAMHANAIPNDPDMLEKRRQRFGYVSPEPSPYLSSRGDSPAVAPSGPVVGTCEKLEKDYFRLTAPPAPHTVRPLHILMQAHDLVRKNWKQNHDYSYACNQLKSLRQDLTVQHIKNDFTIKVYEAHARIALEMGDLGEYNQCQTQLRALYKLNLGGNREEFVAYRILYYIYTCNRTDLNDVLADLTPADKQKPGVQHALQVRSALASGNYHKFFRLYDTAPFMGPYILDKFIERERLAAMAAMCKAYNPDVSVTFLARELSFYGEDGNDSHNPDEGVRQCVDFLCKHGGEELVKRKDSDVRFLTAKARASFEGARAAAFRSVDLKGQI